ncbi:MAG TPA: DNA ligase D [Steroidobacteraceae bacterium]|nr:DNA ligase D [Steroidobacteraceae bacterium]
MAKPALTVYRAKRDFSKTAEPSGRAKVAPSRRLRFVVQKHAASRLHYDLRLELDGVFKSWAVTRGPSVDPADKRLAVEVEDHPLDYGDFEGTIPKGEYGGGTVQLWDRGYWVPEGGKTPEDMLAKGDLKFTLEGARMHGSWVLVRMRGDRFGGKRNNWLLIKHRDEAAMQGEGDALMHDDRSVASGRTMDQIARGVGKRPAPFMVAGKSGARADAVWHSREGGGAAVLAPAPASKPARPSKAAPAPKTPRPSKIKPIRVDELPGFIAPELCKSVDLPPAYAGWGHEVKLDGYRAQLRVQKRRAAIRTRTGLDWTPRFAAVAAEARAFPDCIMDGEIVAMDGQGLPSFSALQAALSDEASERLTYYVFDLLFQGREDLRQLPLSDRKARLEKLLAAHRELEHFRYVAHLTSNGHDVFESAKKMNLEGIVSKKLDAPYRSGRSGAWVKAKARTGQEVVIGGFTSENGEVRSLLAGIHRKGVLQYVGRIGTGFGRDVARILSPRLDALVGKFNPFAGANIPPQQAKVSWVKPELVAEIEFAGWTDGGMIRAAAFKGLREDKPAREVVDERPSGGEPSKEDQAMASKKSTRAAKTGSRASRASSAPAASRTPAASTPAAAPKGVTQVLGVTISHPDKVMWPKTGATPPLSKLELAQYFESVGDWMMPYLAGRPCSLVRMPDGVGGEKFFQRHSTPGMSAQFSSVKIRGDKAAYVQIDRIEGLAAAAQFGTIELHPWNCAPHNPEVAGRLVFDLDPAPDVSFGAVIEAATEVRDRLKKLGLESFCKTTGGKGLHVVTPLLGGKQAVPWPTAKNFAHIVCAQMAHDSPRKYLDVMSKSLRGGKIFLDYLRNDRTATAVAVLSPRARELPTVSMPIDWKAVRAGLDPARFTVISAPALLRKSKPWRGYDEAARSLEDAIRAVTGPSAARKSKR